MERKKFSTAPFKVIDETKKKQYGQLWCPYCGEFRTFNPRAVEEYPRCTDCNISIHDYWVKTVNKLWEASVKPRTK